MSLINKMLLDLDKRGGGEVGAMPRPTGSVTSTASRIGSEWFWRVLAVLMFVAVAWVTWLIWELRPRPVVTELALRATSPSRPVAVAIESGPPDSSETARSDVGGAADLRSGPAPSEPSGRIDGLRLAMELSVPARGVELPRNSVSARPAIAPVAKAARAPVSEPEVGVLPMRIDKRDTSTPRDRADAEFKRALALSNQRRVTESLEAMRMALAIDSTHEPVRQAMVASLLESRRYDDAIQALNEGLTLNPGNAAFAM